MKHLKLVCLSLMAALFVFTSCRTEDDELIVPTNEEALETSSETAELMSRVAFLNDSTIKNSYGKLKCLKIKLPVTVIVNGEKKVIETRRNFQRIVKSNNKEIDFEYPLTVIKHKSTEETIIANKEELSELLNTCGSDDDDDDDNEKCISFEYPITAFIYNKEKELIKTININNDKQLFAFILRMRKHHLVKLKFPITVILSDGSKVITENKDELKNVILEALKSCKKGGGKDKVNILALARCLDFKLPITVYIDGEKKVIETKEAFNELKKVPADKLEIEFPLTVTKKGSTTEIVVNTMEELEALAKNCKGKDDDDDDDDKFNIFTKTHCLDFKLPITVYIEGEKKVIETEEAFNKLKKVPADKLEIEFPLTVTKKGSTTEIVVDTMEKLETLAIRCKGKDDDDDDNDRFNIFMKTARCLDFKLPITVYIEGEKKMIETKEAFNKLKKVPADKLKIEFPLAVTKKGSTTEVVVNTMEELEALAEKCKK